MIKALGKITGISQLPSASEVTTSEDFHPQFAFATSSKGTIKMKDGNKYYFAVDGSAAVNNVNSLSQQVVRFCSFKNIRLSLAKKALLSFSPSRSRVENARVSSCFGLGWTVES